MTLKDNKSIKKAVVLVAVVVITGAIGVVLSAQMGPRRGPDGQGAPGPGMMGGPMQGGPGMMRGPRGGGFGGPMGLAGFGARELGVTDEQRTQMQGIFEAHKDELKAAGDTAMEARKALHDAMASEAADEAKILELANAAGAAESKAIVAQFKVRKEAFQVLTPEQQLKAKELRGQMNERMKNGRERMQRQRNERLDQKGGAPLAV